MNDMMAFRCSRGTAAILANFCLALGPITLRHCSVSAILPLFFREIRRGETRARRKYNDAEWLRSPVVAPFQMPRNARYY